MDTRPVYTLSSKPAVIDSHDEALERARELRDRLRERMPLGQEMRRLPDENVADILESGLYGVMKPKRYGGSELGTETMIDVTIELASADPSVGWVYMLWAAHMWMQAMWPEKAMDEMWENPNGLASSVVSTTGDVVAVDGGFQWNGRGFFSSGVDHCNWLTALVHVVRDGERAEMRWLLIPREDLEIIDDWYTIGLRGTGSKTVVFNDLFIPEYRTVTRLAVAAGEAPGREVNTHAMYGAPEPANFTGAMSVPAIGAAIGLIELFKERLGSRIQVPESVNSPYLPEGMSQTLARLANASATVDAARSVMTLNALRYSQRPVQTVPLEEDMRLRRDMAFTAQLARRAANILYEESGGSALSEKSLLQQFWRDTNAAAAHRGLMWDWQSDAWAKAALGLPMPPLT
ncbi:MAG TPA: acyl-CoA dehydrogenase family protein [Streptosporangiaceae bacterium]|nr:acyl-CoA dehydrogenase family protein [Streptosporangiaceae bacterium]